MRQLVAPFLALLVVVGLVAGAQSDPGTGVSVPTLAEHNVLEGRVTDAEAQAAELAHRVADLEDWVATAPQPSPSPTPTPTPTPTPEPEPEPATFPTRASVGPAVDPTVAYEGDCYFSADESGTLIENRIVDCDTESGLRFADDTRNITFRNSIIRGQMMLLGTVPGDTGADTFPRDPVFTVEDSKIIQSVADGYQDRAICCGHYVVKRSLIQGTHSGLMAHNNVTLVGNYITTDGTNSHQSGLRALRNVVLRGNTITCKPHGDPTAAGYRPYDDSGCSAHAVFYREDLGGNGAPAYNLTIEGNYFKRDAGGGPYFATRFVDCQNWDDCTDIKMTGNQFSLGEGTDGAEFPNDSGDVWSGNVWTDGQPALSGQSR